VVYTDQLLFAVGAASGNPNAPYRCLVLADPGVFSNDMLALGAADGSDGTDNLMFARRVVRWLRNPIPDRRTKCLFVEKGVVQGSFADAGFSAKVAPPPPPIPSLEPLNPKFQAALTDAGNRAVAKIEDEDRLNRPFAAPPDRGFGFGNTLRGIASLLAAAGVGWLIHRAMVARHTPEVALPPRGGSVSGMPAVGPFARRQAELIRAGHLTEPVREYVLNLFVSRGAAPGAAGGAAPVVEVAPGDIEDLARKVSAVWDGVLGPAARPVTPAAWKELEPMIDEVRQAADAGRWRVAPEGGPA
jgi:hypothetical protein